MAHSLAPSAQQGFSSSDAYDKYRPSYPPESVDNLLKQMKIAGVKGARILDLAAGTGKFTELLAKRPEGFEILAVEPHDDMRKSLEAKNLTGVKTLKGFAEKIEGVEDNWADAVIVAQAFHWFATLDVLKEIHRVLAPGATLGMIWNIEDYNAQKDLQTTTDYEAKLKDNTWSLDDEAKRYRHFAWPKIFDEQLKSNPLSINSADPLFSLPLGEHADKWEVWLTKEGAWSRYHTLSHIANLKGEELERTKKHVFEILDEAPKNDKGEIAIHGNTFAFWTTAIPSNTLKQGG